MTMSRTNPLEDGQLQDEKKAGPAANEYVGHQQPRAGAQLRDDIVVICGPLLNYLHMAQEGGQILWRGSVLIVTKRMKVEPVL